MFSRAWLDTSFTQRCKERERDYLTFQASMNSSIIADNDGDRFILIEDFARSERNENDLWYRMTEIKRHDGGEQNC